ncbi:lasso peptide biosynthesis PqqD family chaperone [Bacillus aerolatus]|uniref:Lasso peptide biosynthesis PqqD family chaperone n=1 Tax=Bacillus aerolatus TaxID=2653354 RepID=A0A6I1FYG2_9BACI|nr:lasso peptide biosynthesis PqqD family chaperone [Bacillus aerolatus]KAB7708158.1 lasso peptide biosynthesis PqqD family chaperone [Bacillus aerolatus]
MITNQNISLNYEVTQGQGNIVSDMDGEKVMLSINNGKYYNLGEMGGEIWDLMQAPITVNQMVTTLLSRFQVEQDECEEQVTSFLNHLFAEGLIEIVNKEI